MAVKTEREREREREFNINSTRLAELNGIKKSYISSIPKRKTVNNFVVSIQRLRPVENFKSIMSDGGSLTAEQKTLIHANQISSKK